MPMLPVLPEGESGRRSVWPGEQRPQVCGAWGASAEGQYALGSVGRKSVEPGERRSPEVEDLDKAEGLELR